MRVTRQQMERMIRYEDAEVIVVHKPPFLAVETRDPRQQDLVSLLINRRVANGEAAFAGVVHRLDQPVEGLLVLAKTKDAAAILSAGLRGGDFAKEYLAVVTGVTEESGTLIHTLKKDGKTNTSAVVPAGTTVGKEARLSYERLSAADEKSLLRIRLDTGRHHQIRVQMANQGAGIWGDTKYNPKFRKVKRRYQQIGLYATRLEFEHPLTGEHLIFKNEPEGEAFDIIEMEDF